MIGISDYGEAESSTIAAIREACVATDGHDPLDEASRLRLQNHGLSDARLWLVGEQGFAFLHDGALDLAVAPEHRAEGVGSRLAQAAAEATRTAWSHGNHPAAHALASHHAFTAVRELWVMRRPTSEPLGDLRTPEDLTIRGFREGDQPDLLRVNAAAFAHHPEQGGMDAAELAERMAEPWFEPKGLLIAEDRDGMLGFHWTKRHTPALAEVYVVAIAPGAQGRGLGKTLTLAGLHHLADADEVILYVESDNLPARAVYEGLGFTHVASDTHVQYAAQPRA
ncbi:Mycothiol biosynthesis acetyltransferase [metagenome]|uniref:Mycothiol biosynthesis acetyltransferase n=1 Tax=metagenome TaxID=256318 RepID=A0A2P2C059_9ZZZZ